MDLSQIKSFIGKWIKRLSIGLLVFCIVIVVLAQIFGHKVDPSISGVQDTNTGSNTVSGVKSETQGNTATGIEQNSPQNLTNTSSSSTQAVNIPGDVLLSLGDEKKKEIYFGYRTIQAIPVEILLQGKDISQMSSMQRVELMGSLIKEKETALAKANGLEYEDIDKIVGYAIQKGWNNEFDSTKTGAISKDEREKLNKYIKDERGMIIVRCKKAVEEELKSPSSADFPWSDYQFGILESSIVVSSYVDSKNTYGSEIRSYFKCLVQPGANGPQVLKVVFSE